MKRSILTLIALSSTSALAENAEKVGTAAHGVARQADEHVAHVANWWGIGGQYAESPALGWLTITEDTLPSRSAARSCAFQS